MNIKFKQIRLHNFFSFADATLDLDDMGYTMVEGRNNCKLDNAYSNGSGKSSIFNGICFALTGETAQGISSGIENIFADPNDCWVELSFIADGNEFILKRFKTPKSDMKLTINGEDQSGKGIRESSKLLAAYLPDLTPTLINSIIVLGQGLPNRFTNNNPARRKEILEKLTKSDFMIQSIKDKLDYRTEELKQQLREKEDTQLSIKSQLEVYNKQLIAYNKELDDYADYINSELTIEARIESANAKIQEIQKDLDKIEKEILRLSSESDSINKKILDETAAHQLNLANNLKDLQKRMAELSKQEAIALSEQKSVKAEIKKLESIKDVCPTCGQKIPNIIKPNTTVQYETLAGIESRLVTIGNEMETLDTQQDSITNECNAEHKKIIDKLNDDLVAIKNDLADQNYQKAERLNEKMSANYELAKLNNLKNNHDKLLENIAITNATIVKLSNEESHIAGDILGIETRLDIIQQMTSLARREFRGILLINIINYLNKKVKQYSRVVFGTEELEFILDENAIDIFYCNKHYENLSGGERQKIDIIIQLALRDLLSKQLGIHCNILVLDEIFDNLDSQGCSKIMDLISGLVDISSVFIISHHAQDLELTKDNSIIVEKADDGISTIKIV